jgi:hypothetical protein
LEFAEPGELEVEAERVQVAEFERQRVKETPPASLL